MKIKYTDKKIIELFWGRIDVRDKESCWEWKASKYWNGYGSMAVNGKHMRSHRFSYELHFGKIPNDLCVCHRCDNPGCVNPNHLFLGTQNDNNKDRSNKHRTKTNPARGSDNIMSKLTEEDVIKIRSQRGAKTQRELSDEFHVSQITIFRIVHNLRWKHVLVGGA